MYIIKPQLMFSYIEEWPVTYKNNNKDNKDQMLTTNITHKG